MMRASSRAYTAHAAFEFPCARITTVAAVMIARGPLAGYEEVMPTRHDGLDIDDSRCILCFATTFDILIYFSDVEAQDF